MQSAVLRSLVAGARPCPLSCVPVGPRQPVPQGGVAGRSLALVRRGIVVRQRVDANGSTTAIDAVGPGGAIPLSEADGGSAAYGADDALVCLCPSRVLASAVGGGSAVAGEVVEAFRMVLERVERLSDARNRRTAAARVAAGLCALADTLSPSRRLDVIPAALQQRDLADLLAMRHESVCRVMGALERRGAIERTASGTRIVDRAKLEAQA